MIYAEKVKFARKITGLNRMKFAKMNLLNLPMTEWQK